MVPEDNRFEFIERLVNHITKNLPHDEAPLLEGFVRQYYLSVSPEDLAARSIMDLYGAVVSHWHYIIQRHKGEAKVRVFNPQLEKDGWQSTHTIIEIAFDDMPFLVDSVSIVLNRLNLNIHLIIHMGSMKLKRDKGGKVVAVLDQTSTDLDCVTEAAIYVEIDRQSDRTILDMIEREIKTVLCDVQTVVTDWQSMHQKAVDVLNELEKPSLLIEASVLEEDVAFLKWMIEDHFTFLGFQEYQYVYEGKEIERQLINNSKLGLYKNQQEILGACALSELPAAAQTLLLSSELILVGKTNIRSTVHRPAYMDFIVIKKVDSAGRVILERRFMGLYTAVAYNSSPRQLPLLRKKVDSVITHTGFLPRSHDERALLNILETLPRDDLFQASESELLALSTSILHLQERQRIRLFVRKDVFGYFVSCLVFVPRDKFNSALNERMKEILQQGFKGLEIEYSSRFSESSLARIHYVIRIDPKNSEVINLKQLEQKLADAARTWGDDLKSALVEHAGEERGNELLKRYQTAFPASYQESFSARSAVIDMDYFERLSKENPLGMSLYRPLEEPEEIIRFKLFRAAATIPLSDVVPILENMGLKIISERPYEIIPKNGAKSPSKEGSLWINDYRMIHRKGESFSTESIKEIFQDAFARIWSGDAENDGFNKLVLGAKLTWREIMILRAYAKYLWQAGFTFSQVSIEETLYANPEITIKLVELFKLRFDPIHAVSEMEQMNYQQDLEKSLELVSNLNEDRILRRFRHIILATIRTNYYQEDGTGNQKPYFSFKCQSAQVPELPLPVPLYEIFVYSTRMEGIHLRGAKVARGGIRWSDRRDDFRTEILGLMKTQQVKNAVIVPMGAKGGFVVNKLPIDGSREEIMEEVIACYKILICGMLDLTDNYKGNEIVNPENVVRYDIDDPYLVVAADKGTATFSDIANAISADYHFWLGDAFASGGSTGYDHKKMAITARGAWESVKAHFRILGVDIQTQTFTVMGIGDMAGDVFGNGMLLSKNIKLIAAFNHSHIFLDPNPDPENSFQERARLFNLPRSDWSDYNPEVISKGGGVFKRSAKYIVLSPEIQKALDFYYDRVEPNELIRAILCAPLDLFWNGGIGTYVKASSEPNFSVGDRTNDTVRINGKDLRCKVVGEGGNLGLTQLGRVEYAKLGGNLNTDAIDNSGGVNCSDNEVNIKILLNEVVNLGDLTEKQRNEILSQVQDEVAELVLKNNRSQTNAINVAMSQAIDNLEMHGRLIKEMEKKGLLNRSMEFLPDNEELVTRKMLGQGLTRPEIAILMAYAKTTLKEALLLSDLPEDPYFLTTLERAFPVPLQTRFKTYMPRHRLKREIICTELSNAIVNEMGISFVNRLQDETGALPADIIRSYTVSYEIFKARELHAKINDLNQVEPAVQLKMIQEVNRLIRRGARWFLRNRREGIQIVASIEKFKAVSEVSEALPDLLSGHESEMETLAQNFIAGNVPKDLAYRVGGMSAMFSALDIVEAAKLNDIPVKSVAAIYFSIGNRLELSWFRDLIKKHSVSNHWEALARAMFRDDLDHQQRILTISIIHHNEQLLQDPDALIDKWLTRHGILMRRWEFFIAELKNTGDTDFTMFSIALRELLEIAISSNHRIRAKNNKIYQNKTVMGKSGDAAQGFGK